MMNSLNIIGGSYLETCIEPNYRELFGSGLRGAAALSKKNFNVYLHSFIGEDFASEAKLKSKAFGYHSKYSMIEDTVEFEYYHPLSIPKIHKTTKDIVTLPNIRANNILYYGMIEGTVSVDADYVVYDPQNHVSFRETKSVTKHLALILNRNEAFLLCKKKDSDIKNVGKSLMISENAEVVVIKNGSQGALVFDELGVHEIPVYHTNKVWPIGSGDIFSAAFAWKWIFERLTPKECANYASKFTAQFVEFQHLPLHESYLSNTSLPINYKKKSIYLAGPFFNIGQRFLVNELRNALIDFGNDVFSPYHDSNLAEEKFSHQQAKEIASLDLLKIKESNAVLAIASGLDAGTLFEIGYASSIGVKVVVLVENEKREDLLMLIGSNCVLTEDISTAVYECSW